jgi:hypothetical protein
MWNLTNLIGTCFKCKKQVPIYNTMYNLVSAPHSDGEYECSASNTTDFNLEKEIPDATKHCPYDGSEPSGKDSKLAAGLY